MEKLSDTTPEQPCAIPLCSTLHDENNENIICSSTTSFEQKMINRRKIRTKHITTTAWQWELIYCYLSSRIALSIVQFRSVCCMGQLVMLFSLPAHNAKRLRCAMEA